MRNNFRGKRILPLIPSMSDGSTTRECTRACGQQSPWSAYPDAPFGLAACDRVVFGRETAPCTGPLTRLELLKTNGVDRTIELEWHALVAVFSERRQFRP